MSVSETPHILLVEDDENDVFIMNRAVAKADLNLTMHVANSGREAIEYLSGAGKYVDRESYPLPQYIFLDLKLPYVHGFEVLEWIKNQIPLRPAHVFILTSSAEERDRETAAKFGVNAYLVKPPTRQMLAEILKSGQTNGHVKTQ